MAHVCPGCGTLVGCGLEAEYPNLCPNCVTIQELHLEVDCVAIVEKCPRCDAPWEKLKIIMVGVLYECMVCGAFVGQTQEKRRYNVPEGVVRLSDF